MGKFEIYEPDPLQHEAPPGAGIRFGDQLALVGWSLHAPPDLAAGETFSLTVVWQSQQQLADDYATFAHLVDESGQGWAGDDHQPYDGLYPTSTWGAGEMVRDSFTLTVPADAPLGLYDVVVGWYVPGTEERLPVGEGNTFRVAVLPLGGQEADSTALTPVGAHFGPMGGEEIVALEGYALETGPGATGHPTLVGSRPY